MIERHDWVLAGPFRAQLRHLLDASGLPLPHLASVLDVPVQLCARLLVDPTRDTPAPRHLRPLTRISPLAARRLLVHSAGSLRRELNRSVDAAPSAEILGELLAAGHRLTTVHRVSGLSLETLSALLDGTMQTCPARVAAAVRAAAIWAETHPCQQTRLVAA